jgi:hypothetical protein
MRQLKNGEQLVLCPLDQVKRVVPASTAQVQQTSDAAAAAQQLGDGKGAAAAGGMQQQHGASVLGQAELAERMQQLQLAVQRDAAQLGSRAGQQQLQAVGALQSQQVSALHALLADQCMLQVFSWMMLLCALEPGSQAVANVNACGCSNVRHQDPWLYHSAGSAKEYTPLTLCTSSLVAGGCLCRVAQQSPAAATGSCQPEG